MTLPIVLSLVVALLAAAPRLVGDGPDLAVGQCVRSGACGDRRRPQPHALRPGSVRRRRGACRRRSLAMGVLHWPDSQLVLIGSIVIGAMFFLRGTAGYSPRWRGRFAARPFRTLDFYLYSPLCLALGVGFIKLLTSEMH
jgi:hypothetical protein